MISTRPIPTRSDEMLDVVPGENGETVAVRTRPRGSARARRDVIVVVDPTAARVLARRLLAVADQVDGRGRRAGEA